MTNEWHFNKARPGDMNRNPVSAEFFSAEAINKPGEALVREAIQNSLDAGQNGSSVIVRILVSGEKQWLPSSQVRPYFDGLRRHVTADENGLRDVPGDSEPCPFLVIEDFGTLGLTGDPSQWHPTPDDKNNHFFKFLRTEGISDKAEGKGGRWGLGKRVFQRSSRINTFFALTVRSDDQRTFLMGQTILKTHHINGEYYCPDGWFGSSQEVNGNTLPMPIEDEAMINTFVRFFDLQRGKDPGLSIVIPWHDKELTEQELLSAVLRDYFWPILQSRLEVLVETPGIRSILDAKTIGSELKKISGDLEKEIGPLLELGRWAQDADSKIFTLSMPNPERALKWSPELFDAEIIKKIREQYERGDRIALRVNLTVREKDKEPKSSFFDVFFVRDERAHEGRPTFIRGGIIIPDVDSPKRTRGVRSLVIIEDKPLAALLGDSENPAHTQWQKDGANFKNKYICGPSYLAFVRNSIHEIVNILCEDTKQKDRVLLIDLFSLPALPEEKPVTTKPETPQPKPGEEPEIPPIILPPSNPRPFQINKIGGGFVVTRGDDDQILHPYLNVKIAYHVRRGNPFRKYNPADFEVDKPPIEIKAVGASVVEATGNNLLFKIEENDFRFTVTGFDPRRDLRINIAMKEEHHVGEDD